MDIFTVYAESQCSQRTSFAKFVTDSPTFSVFTLNTEYPPLLQFDMLDY